MGCYVTVWQIGILLRLWLDLTPDICFYNPTQLTWSHFRCGFQKKKNREKQQQKNISDCIIPSIDLPESPCSENKILAKRKKFSICMTFQLHFHKEACTTCDGVAGSLCKHWASRGRNPSACNLLVQLKFSPAMAVTSPAREREDSLFLPGVGSNQTLFSLMRHPLHCLVLWPLWFDTRLWWRQHILYRFACFSW